MRGGAVQSYYWPYSLGFDVFAYAPAMAGGVPEEPTIAKNGLTYDGFDAAENKHTLTCDLRNFRVGDQEDLSEFIYAYSTNQTFAAQGESGIVLQFQHPLSAIFIRIGSAFDGLRLNSLTLTSTDLGNGHGTGIYCEGTGTCSTDGTTWTKLEAATAYDFTFYVNKIMSEDLYIGNVFQKPFLVMPQKLCEREGLDDVVMKISYAKRKDDGISYFPDKEVSLPITDKIKTWEAGKAYYYTLELGKDESVIVGASVEPWNYYGNYTTIPIDKDD